MRVAPQYDQCYLNLARMYVIARNREKARSILEALLKEHPDHLQAKKALDEIR
jgi:Tfp pilus assembly protein FimV